MYSDSFIVGDYQALLAELSDERAKKYLKFGFNMRALQIMETRFQISEAIEKAGGKNLGPYQICQTNIFLNSFYLNMLGAIDNLAWVIQHEFSVIEGASEGNKKRNDISLFGKKYLQSLRVIDESAANHISEHKDWFAELKEFRDPAAHRMPLYCPPGVVNSEQIDEYNDAKTKLASKNYLEDSRSYMDAQHELAMVGKFQPIFTSFSEEEDKIYPLLRTIENDYFPFWSLGSYVLSFFRENLTSTVKGRS